VIHLIVGRAARSGGAATRGGFACCVVQYG
jgi:hypothetical protein